MIRGEAKSRELIDQWSIMSSSDEKKPFERLPTDVVPVNYKVELRPDLKAWTFQGKLEITTKVDKYTELANYLYM